MLYKRGKTWWISFTTPNGQRIRRSAGTTEKAQAEELHDSLKAQAWRQVQLGDRPAYTWDDAGVRWLDEKAHKASLVTDEIFLAWLQDHFRGVPLRDLNRDRIMTVLQIKKTQTSASTANHYMALIRSMLRAAVEWGWLDYPPLLRPYPTPTQRVRWLTPEQAVLLLNELPPHLRAMAAFSLATGLRRSNVTGLEWSQLDLGRKIAWIHADQAKARKPITVPLDDVAISILRAQIGNHPIYVFTYCGKRVTQVNTKAWKKALERAGIENFRWHDLRHTWASWHIQAGTPLNTLQDLGGWHSSEMVRKYAHLSPEHLAQYAQNAGQNLQPAYGTKLSQPHLVEEAKRTVTS